MYIIIKYAVETFYVKDNSSGSVLLLQGSEGPLETVHQVTLMNGWMDEWMDGLLVGWIDGLRNRMNGTWKAWTTRLMADKEIDRCILESMY